MRTPGSAPRRSTTLDRPGAATSPASTSSSFDWRRSPRCTATSSRPSSTSTRSSVWILNRARSLIGARAASVGIVEHDEIVYRYRSAEGENPNGQIRAARVASLSGICARTGQTVVCTDSETDPRVDIAACRAQGLRSMIIVPLRCRGPVVGVLNVNAPDPDAFDASDVQTLELIAGAISGAYGHAADLAAKRELLDELETTVAALKTSEAELARQALHDPLTGLPNRTLFHDRLRTALARRDLPEDGVAVMFVDLDGFKDVNDNHGHDAGDTVLSRRRSGSAEPCARATRSHASAVTSSSSCSKATRPRPWRSTRRSASSSRSARRSPLPDDIVVTRSPRASASPPAGASDDSSSATPTPPCTAPRPRRAAATCSSSRACASPEAERCVRRPRPVL